MSAYTSGNNAPTQMRQAPNRKGNTSAHTPKGNTGVTAVTRPQGNVAYAAGHQGAPKTGGNPTGGRGQKVMVDVCSCDNTTPRNDGYMNKSVKNYLG